MLKVFRNVVRAGLLVAGILCCQGDLAIAQSGAPSAGSIFGGPSDIAKRHLTTTGKPCLTFTAEARPQLVNRDIFDHWIAAVNGCPLRIKVNVCYYRSLHCVLMDLPPYDRKETVLGFFPKQKDFRYEYKEQF
jgi:hypothetical protein